jgi:protein-S-isoprenylcysteine O-methyltransferase Ste14
MLLTKRFEISGNYLFRWRSYLFLITVGIFFSALPYFSYPLNSHILDVIWEILCLAISFFGLFVRIITVGYTPKRTSGRNTKKGQVADYLNTKGMYSIVRNPLYLGNFFIVLGISLFLRIWWISAIYALLFIFLYERIIFAEEQFLEKKFGQQYTEWASKTPAFFPKFSQWQTPDLPFSYKKVLRKEYHGFLGIILSMFALEVISDLYLHHYFIFDFMWKCLVGFGLIVYVIIRYLHKKTSLLKTPGR